MGKMTPLRRQLRVISPPSFDDGRGMRSRRSGFTLVELPAVVALPPVPAGGAAAHPAHLTGSAAGLPPVF